MLQCAAPWPEDRLDEIGGAGAAYIQDYLEKRVSSVVSGSYLVGGSNTFYWRLPHPRRLGAQVSGALHAVPAGSCMCLMRLHDGD